MSGNTETVINEMTIDTQDFDIFSSLDNEEVQEAGTQAENTLNDDVAEDENATEEENESGDGEINFEDLDDAEQDENGHDVDKEDEDDESDEETEDDDDDSEDDVEEESDDEDDGEEEVDFETYQVTLPNGEEVNLNEAIQGYKDAKALEAERQEFEQSKEHFVQESSDVDKYLKLAKLESDRVIEDYKDFNWAELAKENPQAYVENKEFLERYIVRNKEIQQAMTDREQQADIQAKEEFQLKAQSCVATLQNEIPGWSESVYQDLIDYAIDNGAAENEILKCVDPSVFLMLNKARQFDKGRQVVKAKIKKSGSKSPKRVMKAAPKSVSKPKAQVKAANLEKIMDSGDVSNLDLFNSLED